MAPGQEQTQDHRTSSRCHIDKVVKLGLLDRANIAIPLLLYCYSRRTVTGMNTTNWRCQHLFTLATTFTFCICIIISSGMVLLPFIIMQWSRLMAMDCMPRNPLNSHSFFFFLLFNWNAKLSCYRLHCESHHKIMAIKRVRRMYSAFSVLTVVPTVKMLTVPRRPDQNRAQHSANYKARVNSGQIMETNEMQAGWECLEGYTRHTAHGYATVQTVQTLNHY